MTAALSDVDIVVTATASIEPVLTRDTVAAALARRAGGPTPRWSCSTSPCRATSTPAVADLPGVLVVDIDRLAADLARRTGRRPTTAAVARDRRQPRSSRFLSWLRGADVAPTVAALRARADEVVAAELRRLAQRRPELTDEQRAEVAHTVHRVVQRLLHSPTVRVRQLAAEPGGDQYAALLRELFDLEVPHTAQVDAVPDIAPGCRSPTGR